MKKNKEPKDVLGWQINCPNFIQCPLCFGCRHYSSSNLACKQCEVDFKNNICNVSLHKDDLIAKFITRNKITIKKCEE